MLANVAQGGRTEDRIGDSVEQDISVGMSFQPAIVGDLDSAEDEATSRRITMSIVTDSRSRRPHSRM